MPPLYGDDLKRTGVYCIVNLGILIRATTLGTFPDILALNSATSLPYPGEPYAADEPSKPPESAQTDEPVTTQDYNPDQDR